ncbi:MAG: hypothetical protein M4579_001566 [Chaenotheca gracillima]|nr:MAG: hypothetical protein M4579_001566 [Chaenotheca gracillima]
MTPSIDSDQTHSSVLIVGAGIFGTSTAYHLSLQASDHPGRTVTILDRAPFPPAPAASTDYNKIVRADYGVSYYMELGYEAMDAWATWPIFRALKQSEQNSSSPAFEGDDVYHRTGWIMFDEKGSDLASRIRRNFAKTGRGDPTSDIELEEAKKMWGGVLGKSDLSDFDSAYWNPEAGWVDAAEAVRRMMAEAVQRKVRYEVGEASELVLGNEDVKGVRTSDGRVFTADKIILATGAWTPRLMLDVEKQLKLEDDERVKGQMTAAGVCVAHYRSNDDTEFEQCKRLPVVIFGQSGEILPPTKDRIFKFTNATSFTNTIHLSGGRTVSTPPDRPQDEVPEKLRAETEDIIRREMPDMLAHGRKPDFWRLCWDAVTPSQNQLITRHPNEKLRNLYFAVGGSFHSWKFLPIIGKYVVEVLEDKPIGEEKTRHWRWKTGDEGFGRGAHEKVVPKRELKDLN